MTRTLPPGFTACKQCGSYNHPSEPKCGKCGTSSEQMADGSLARVFDDALALTEEKKLQAKAVEWLECNGAVGIIHHATNKRTTCAKGVSDIVCLYKGKFISAEAKLGANKPTQAQQEYIDAVNANGGCGFVFKSLDELKANLERIE